MFKLERALKKILHLSSAERTYKRALWLELSSAYDHEYRPEGRGLHWKLATVPALALVVILMTGTGVYAYESPAVSDGHPLYPLKQGIEQIHHAVFVHSSDDEEHFQQWVTERRMLEIRIKARQLPVELRSQIMELKASIEAQDLSEEEKRQLFREEVEALLINQ